MSLPTGSSVGVSIACTGLRTLPVVKQEENDELRPHLARGTAVHKFLEDTFNLGGPDAALALMAPGDTKDFCATLDTKAIIPDGAVEAEPAWAYCVDTRDVRVLGRSLGRAYADAGATARDIPGTADVVFCRTGVLWGVADYKITDSDLYAPHPQRSGQLKFLGLCLMRARGLGQVLLECIRVGSTGRHHVEAWMMDAFEADAFEKSMRTSLDAEPVFQEGPHCQVCRSFSVCPAKTSLLRNAMAESHVAAMSLNVNEENAPRLVQVLEDLDDLCKFYKKELQEYAKEFPILMPNGDIYGPVAKTFRTVADIPQARAWLESAYGKDKADRCVKTETTSKINIGDMASVLGRADSEIAMKGLQAAGYVSVRETRNVGLAPARKRLKASAS